MAKIDNTRRIVSEDFPEKDRETIAKLGDILNSHMEQVYNAFQKQISFANLNQEVVKITVRVDSDGTPRQTLKFSSNLRRLAGLIVISARNRTNSATYPESAVFVSFDQNASGLYNVRNITGLQANNEYDLTLMLIGSDD